MPSGYVFLYSFIILYDNCLEYIWLYIHIGVGSALLVSMSWAMREPPSVR
jgi:membrane-associated PAP2 superfamily phosphatase